MRYIFFITLISLFLIPIAVGAFSISPLSYKSNIEAGKSGTVWINIINNEDFDQIFEVGVLGARQNNLGQPIFKNNTDLAEGWVVPETKEVEVKANDEKKLAFNIQVPKNSPPGSHYLGLFAESKISATPVGIKSRLLTLLTLQVSGIATEKLMIKKWGEVKNVLFSGDLSFDLKLKNEGNVDLPLIIKVKLFDNKDVLVEEKMVSVGANLMAGLDRDYKIDFTKNKFGFGRYRAIVQIDYGLTKQSVAQINDFWFLPQTVVYYLSGIVSAIFLFIVMLFFLKRKSYVQGK